MCSPPETVGAALGRTGDHRGRLVGDGQAVFAEAAGGLLVDEDGSVTVPTTMLPLASTDMPSATAATLPMLIADDGEPDRPTSATVYRSPAVIETP